MTQWFSQLTNWQQQKHMLKDAMPVSFDQNCLHLTFYRNLSRESYSLKYEKLPNIVICACLNIIEIFCPITLKQLNSFTAIDMFCWLSGREVTLQTSVHKVLGSIPGSSKDFYVCFFVVVFSIFVDNTIIYIKFWQFILQC